MRRVRFWLFLRKPVSLAIFDTRPQDWQHRPGFLASKLVELATTL
jgi:hypothetical protein